jgi:hypothetical protein
MTAAIYMPSLGLWALAIALATFHTLWFYRFAFRENSDVGTPIVGVLVATLAAAVYPLAFFSVGAFAMSPAHDALQWLEVEGHPLSAATRATIVATADGALSAAFTYFLAFGLAAATMGGVVCASRHLLRARSSTYRADNASLD